MAVFSVKVAGITQSNDPSSNGVIQTTNEVNDAIPLLIEERTISWIGAGLRGLMLLNFQLTVSMMTSHHGELRGVEVKFLILLY